MASRYTGQIGAVSPIPAAPRAPYALESIAFPFPALAAMAGRAPLGGPRELALACMLVGRLVVDARNTREPLTPDQLRARALAARQWLASAAIPPQTRAALTKLAEATGAADRALLRAALDSVMTVTASQLDAGARLEFGRLAQAIAG